MGKVKQLIEDAIERGYAYNKDAPLPEWVHPKSMGKVMAYRNDKQHNPNPDWYEDIPDLMGQALADAIRAYDAIPEADDMPLWIQLELDLWEGQHGIGAFTAWDLADGGTCG